LPRVGSLGNTLEGGQYRH